MPPESLFRHSLLCPSAPGSPLDLSFLDTLRYPTSLKSESHLRTENRLLPPPSHDSCYSLEAELSHIESNFFYRDCPAVVTTPEPDASARTFTLPVVLSTQCANFTSEELEQQTIQILPSELWAVRCEAEAWRDYPASYSNSVLRVASDVHLLEEGCLKKWVVSNSYSYGILIDAAMRDHIFVLLKLCLKAVGTEALRSIKSLLSKDDRLLNPCVLSFECPGLVESFMWLSTLLSVLYGEVNGKLFAMGMLREALLLAGSSSLWIRPGENMVRGESGASVGDCSQGSCSGEVFVSQVAAAIAALRERFLLEERIKMMRFSRHPTKHQLLSEYSYASTRGCEERGRRPNYRAVLEHDGLYWHRGQNEDQNKTKTKEELLAEERDYKRRRMSYRGKKVKRTPKQVIRDIIVEHMEQIKQAGGIGCNLKVATDTVVGPVENNPQNGRTADINEMTSIHSDTTEKRADPFIFKTPLHDKYNLTSSKHGSISSSARSIKSRDSWNSRENVRHEGPEHGDGYWRSKHGEDYRRSEHGDDYRRSEHEGEKYYESRGSSNHRSYSHSHKQKSHRQVDAEAHQSKYGRMDSWSKDDIDRSTLTSMSTKDEDAFLSDTRNEDRGRTSEKRRSGSVMQKEFEDRYDPFDNQDGYGSIYDDTPVGSSSLRSDKSRTNDAKHHDELLRRGHATKSRHRAS